MVTAELHRFSVEKTGLGPVFLLVGEERIELS